ncbi:hypothetical protein EVAR_33948_1 [Eumeta japonica]|uniref:Uncharacterized protein n=1 Tax=Eumeta variegata TaxID=151549 RepID=A0A4C1VXT4_EUMVA|nr:hypothetical protein EVAR_33948_1 [Eumeta japonica]
MYRETIITTARPREGAACGARGGAGKKKPVLGAATAAHPPARVPRGRAASQARCNLIIAAPAVVKPCSAAVIYGRVPRYRCAARRPPPRPAAA